MKRTILILLSITLIALIAIQQLFSQPLVIVEEYELPEDGLAMYLEDCPGGGLYKRCWNPGVACIVEEQTVCP
jgi:hypothetical protein